MGDADAPKKISGTSRSSSNQLLRLSYKNRACQNFLSLAIISILKIGKLGKDLVCLSQNFRLFKRWGEAEIKLPVLCFAEMYEQKTPRRTGQRDFGLGNSPLSPDLYQHCARKQVHRCTCWCDGGRGYNCPGNAA